jgi:hypothetical protein
MITFMPALYENPSWFHVAVTYPSIIASDGRRYYVDRSGLIDGLVTSGPNRGKRRCDHPYAPPEIEEIHAVMSWADARRLVPIKTHQLSSYAAKHYAERFAGMYVSNGAAIVAFYNLRFSQFVCPVSGGELNTSIAVSRKSYRGLPEVLRRTEGFK